MRVLDGFGSGFAIDILRQALLRQMIAVAGMQGAIFCLDDARIMILGPPDNKVGAGTGRCS
jgi:hypothetical protein